MTAIGKISRRLALIALLALAPVSGRVQAPASSPSVSPPSGDDQPAEAAAPDPSPAPDAAEPAPSPPRPAGAMLSADQAMPPALLEAFVDGVVRQAMADHHLAGVAVSVVQNGQTVLARGYGFARLSPYRPVQPDRTLFRLGPVSTAFTAVLLLQEIEAGRMRLDAPVNLYLPQALRMPNQGFAAPVRVRDLMDQTAGFESRSLGQLAERDFARVRPLAEYLAEERPARVAEPGVEVGYSPYASALAGAAVSSRSGRTFESLVETRITGPLRLARTTFREPHPARRGLPAGMAPDLAADVADGFRWTPGGLRQRPFEYLEQAGPADAASSTAGDMARFMTVLLADGERDGVRLYGPTAARLLATPGVAGFRQYRLPGGFEGPGLAGGTLSFHATMVLVPRLRLGVFIAANSADADGLTGALPGRIVERFYGPGSPAPAPGSEALLARRSAFEGDYRSNVRAFHGLEGFIERFGSLAHASVTEDGRLHVRRGHRGDHLTPIGDPSGGRFLDEDGAREASFDLAGGRAARFTPPDGLETYRRVSWWDETGTLLLVTLAVAALSLLSLLGVFTRNRREFRESSSQSRAGVLQATQAALWLGAIGLFAVWARSAEDPAAMMYDWPGLPLVLASSSALVASLMGILGVLLLPLVWRGGRRLDSWTAWRKLQYTLTALLFLFYGGLLGYWGALEPWSA